MKKAFFAFFLLITTTASAQKLPDFALVDMNGDTLKSANLQGKHVYINVWETWCKPCIEEISVLNYAIDKTEDIVLLAITPAKRKKVEKTLEKHPFNFTVISDAEELCKTLGVTGYPTHYFVNADGNVKEFDARLYVTFRGNKKQAAKAKKNMTTEEWTALFFEQNKDRFYTKLLEMKRDK